MARFVQSGFARVNRAGRTGIRSGRDARAFGSSDQDLTIIEFV
jgi:hypothetical protein